MRRSDGNGEKEFSGAMVVICLRSSERDDWRKSEGSWRSVIRSVLVGFAGRERDGGVLAMFLVSKARDGLLLLLEEGDDGMD